MIMTLNKIINTFFIEYTNKINIMIIVVVINHMYNILYLEVYKNRISSQFLPNGLDNVIILYIDLVNLGFSTCSALNEVIKLLLFSNTKLTLADF